MPYEFNCEVTNMFHMHVLLLFVIISCSWYADLDSAVVQESPLLACALVELSCSFYCLCTLPVVSPVGLLVVVVIFPANQVALLLVIVSCSWAAVVEVESTVVHEFRI